MQQHTYSTHIHCTTAGHQAIHNHLSIAAQHNATLAEQHNCYNAHHRTPCYLTIFSHQTECPISCSSASVPMTPPCFASAPPSACPLHILHCNMARCRTPVCDALQYTQPLSCNSSNASAISASSSSRSSGGSPPLSSSM